MLGLKSLSYLRESPIPPKIDKNEVEKWDVEEKKAKVKHHASEEKTGSRNARERRSPKVLR